MNFKEYQQKALESAIYPHKGKNVSYPALGLAGETGEVCEKIKKYYRDGVLDPQALSKELGDVLWYISALAFELGLNLDDIAVGNIEKLQSRKQRNKLHGEGDNR